MPLRYCAGPAYYRQDVLNRRLLFKTNRQQQHQRGNHHPSFLRFWNWAEEKISRCSQNFRRRRNAVKTETQQTFVNGLLGFITLGIYTPLEARVLLTHCGRAAHRYGHLSALLINILLGFLPVVFA